MFRLRARVSLFACLMIVMTVSVATFAATAEVLAVPLDPAKNTQRFLSSSDANNLKEGLYAADRKAWNDAKIFRSRLKDPVAQTLLHWRYLAGRGTYPSFGELIEFLRAHPDWPERDALMRRAEEIMPLHTDPQKVVAIFAGQEPLTGDGKFKLGAAYISIGQKNYGTFWIREAWTKHTLVPDIESRIRSDYRQYLRKEDHRARLDHLLWWQSYSAARRLFPYLDKDDQLIASARMDLAVGRSKQASLAPVPRKHLDDPGLIYEQARRFRKADMEKEARDILKKAPKDEARLGRSDKWWTERGLLAREAMEERLFGEAYDLAAHHVASSGVDFAEAQWLAGWLALRYLDDPEQSILHFQTLYDGVRYPISRARAAYWLGRALERTGNVSDAHNWYVKAAELQTTYYGQLAAERISPSERPKIALPDPWTVSKSDIKRILNKEIIQAVVMLHDFGQPKTLKQFVQHLAEHLEDPIELSSFADILGQLGYPHYSLKVAKKASLKHVFLIDRSYPVNALPEPVGGAAQVEPALVLGLSRQESEFNPEARSHAGALGTMQLMPATAKAVARKYGLRYDVGRLSRDASYNMTLGSAFLADLVRRFDGSYILAAAAYNAGPTRVRQWLATYGDPRNPSIDPIDWIETIPFSETRNYVQRILENTQVYRFRLARKPTPLLLSNDLGLTSHKSAVLASWSARSGVTPKPMAAPSNIYRAAPEVTADRPDSRDDGASGIDQALLSGDRSEGPRVPATPEPEQSSAAPNPTSDDILLPAEEASSVASIGTDAAADDTLSQWDAFAVLRGSIPHVPKPKPSQSLVHGEFAMPVAKPLLSPSGEATELVPVKKPEQPS